MKSEVPPPPEKLQRTSKAPTQLYCPLLLIFDIWFDVFPIGTAVLPRFCDDHAGDLSPPFPFPTFLLLPSPSALSFLAPLPPFSPLLTPVLRFLSLPLEVEHLKSSKESWERCFGSAVTVSSSAGSGAEPQLKSNLVHFSLKV